ncbi:hypothetical protein VMT65_15850 [Nocardia sp. CDC153]|uniref:DUF7373 family lipoprotein n=1 Tax=Nocardia sp. CDC153 TaxID=3112167 RepID=UPI002DBE9388|nr:hypothetical protein [Nocardia sp. CDC153]MEC3954516.1 hypothetical protein [Nocardia sp. CDC153]
MDVSQLDPGNYPVVPRQIANRTADITVGDLIQESIRIAEHMPLPVEVDDRLIYGQGGHAITADYPPMGVDDFNDRAPGLIAGWETGGRHRSDYSLGLSVDLTVMRFTTSAQASAAVDFLVGDHDPQYPDRGPVTVAGYPGAKSVLTYSESVKTLFAQDNYVYWLFTSDDLTVPEGPGLLLDTTRKVLDHTVDSMKGFQPTPVDKLAGLATDPDELLGRTLPAGKGQIWATEGLYPPHAALGVDDRPAATKRAFDEAGVDVVAHALSGLYRAKDAAAAQHLTGAFIDQLTDRYKPIDPPPGLPTARCLQTRDDDAVGARFVCYLPYERYLAEVSADQSQDLRQRVSAQYELLAYGHI